MVVIILGGSYPLLFSFFAFGPKSGPRGSFGTKKSAIDAESARESENTTQHPQQCSIFFGGTFSANRETWKTCLRRQGGSTQSGCGESVGGCTGPTAPPPETLTERDVDKFSDFFLAVLA